MATIHMLFWDEIYRADKIAKIPNQADEPDGENYAVFRKCRAILDLTWSAGYPQTLGIDNHA